MDTTKHTNLGIAQEWCDENDKSTEFMIAYMQDFADATHDEVIDFLLEQADD